MKPLLAGLAICLIMIFSLAFQMDYNNYRLESQNLKYCADEASASASLYYYLYESYDDKSYVNGYKIFREQDGIKAIEKTLKVYLKTDDMLLPKEESYWKDSIKYNVYFFDDDMLCSVYSNGIKKNEFTFSYPYLYKDDLLGYVKLITKPTAVVTINAGYNKFSLKFLKPVEVIRSSAYEYFY